MKSKEEDKGRKRRTTKEDKEGRQRNSKKEDKGRQSYNWIKNMEQNDFYKRQRSVTVSFVTHHIFYFKIIILSYIKPFLITVYRTISHLKEPCIFKNGICNFK